MDRKGNILIYYYFLKKTVLIFLIQLTKDAGVRLKGVGNICKLKYWM